MVSKKRRVLALMVAHWAFNLFAVGWPEEDVVLKTLREDFGAASTPEIGELRLNNPEHKWDCFVRSALKGDNSERDQKVEAKTLRGRFARIRYEHPGTADSEVFTLSNVEGKGWYGTANLPDVVERAAANRGGREPRWGNNWTETYRWDLLIKRESAICVRQKEGELVIEYAKRISSARLTEQFTSSDNWNGGSYNARTNVFNGVSAIFAEANSHSRFPDIHAELRGIRGAVTAEAAALSNGMGVPLCADPGFKVQWYATCE